MEIHAFGVEWPVAIGGPTDKLKKKNVSCRNTCNHDLDIFNNRNNDDSYVKGFNYEKLWKRYSDFSFKYSVLFNLYFVKRYTWNVLLYVKVPTFELENCKLGNRVRVRNKMSRLLVYAGIVCTVHNLPISYLQIKHFLYNLLKWK